MTVRGLIQRPWQVEAFLAGRRTQVRVRVKVPPGDLEPTEIWRTPDGRFIGTWDLDPIDHKDHDGLPYSESFELRCPLGKPGDVLAVRETHHITASNLVIYRADYPANAIDRGLENIPAEGDVRWLSPAVMPLRLARLRYRVLDVRAERASDAGESDILAEGVTVDRVAEWTNAPWSLMPTLFDARRVLWKADHGPGSWERDWCFAATVEAAP